MNERFIWDRERGIGFYPVETYDQYDLSYFKNYEKRSETPVGEALTNARIDLVEKYVGSGQVVDIGIGSGHFILRRGTERTSGYDVNPTGIHWLLERGIWHDPYFKPAPNATCWDSLEHMEHPEHFVVRVKGFLFVSLPIFKDREHALASKHFKPEEHFWYCTSDGFIRWMKGLGLSLLEQNRMESDLGREDIGTFVFQRTAPER